MKKKTNIKAVIRQIVREEVAMAINEVITELKQPTRQVSQPKPKKKIVEKTSYTSNSVLNDILNETKGGIPSEDGGYETMGGGVYDSSKMSEIMNRKGGGDLASSFGVDPNQAPDFLTRDYSGLMKAIDKKKKGKLNG
jgi:hypothetical protein